LDNNHTNGLRQRRPFFIFGFRYLFVTFIENFSVALFGLILSFAKNGGILGGLGDFKLE